MKKFTCDDQAYEILQAIAGFSPFDGDTIDRFAIGKTHSSSEPVSHYFIDERSAQLILSVFKQVFLESLYPCEFLFVVKE